MWRKAKARVVREVAMGGRDRCAGLLDVVVSCLCRVSATTEDVRQRMQQMALLRQLAHLSNHYVRE